MHPAYHLLKQAHSLIGQALSMLQAPPADANRGPKGEPAKPQWKGPLPTASDELAKGLLAMDRLHQPAGPGR
jgi:hypothetical protein